VAGGRVVADFFVEGGTSKAAFAPDGRRFLITAEKQTRVYEVGGAACRATGAVGAGPLHALALSPDDGSLACMRRSADPDTYEIAVWRRDALGAGPSARRRCPGSAPSPPTPLAFGGPWLAHAYGPALSFWDTSGRAAHLPGSGRTSAWDAGAARKVGGPASGPRRRAGAGPSPPDRTATCACCRPATATSSPAR
jgi:hypothetical protein